MYKTVAHVFRPPLQTITITNGTMCRKHRHRWFCRVEKRKINGANNCVFNLKLFGITVWRNWDEDNYVLVDNGFEGYIIKRIKGLN